MTDLELLAMAEREIGRLQAVLVDAMAAMDRGEYGQARRIMVTGADRPLITHTAILKGGAA